MANQEKGNSKMVEKALMHLNLPLLHPLPVLVAAVKTTFPVTFDSERSSVDRILREFCLSNPAVSNGCATRIFKTFLQHLTI